jgi:hypothetical protein
VSFGKASVRACPAAATAVGLTNLLPYLRFYCVLSLDEIQIAHLVLR